jgi:hypothetical protein
VFASTERGDVEVIPGDGTVFPAETVLTLRAAEKFAKGFPQGARIELTSQQYAEIVYTLKVFGDQIAIGIRKYLDSRGVASVSGKVATAP